MSLEHRVVLPGLASSSAYVASVDARSATGDAASATLPFTTAPIPADVSAAVQDGTMLVGGAPFFPLITWQECPSQWYTRPHRRNQPLRRESLHRAQLAAHRRTGACAQRRNDGRHARHDRPRPGRLVLSGRGGCAWTDRRKPQQSGRRPSLPDAHRAFLSGGSSAAGRARHVSGLLDRADVVGFDLYPLQELCRPELIPWIFDAQQHLMQLAGPEPTFQWIEVAR